MLYLLFLISERCFTVLILSLLEGMLSKSFWIVICLLCSLVTKRSCFFQAVRFSHQARFYGKFRNYSFVCHFYLYFDIHLQVLVLWSSFPNKRKSWSWWILCIGYLSARKVVLSYFHLLVLCADHPVKLRRHPIECFWYCMSQLYKNPFHR